MAGFITDIVQNSVSGLVSGAVTTVGGYAGNAVNGVGNLIESSGEAIGNGIAKSFQGVGDSISSYGTAARNATAPNSGSYTATKKVDPKSKPVSQTGEKKALPNTAQKTLPSTKPMKALPAPPARKDEQKKSVEKAKSAYTPTGSAYKPNAGGYTAPAAKKANPVKSRTLQSGKVVASKQSLPQSLKAKSVSTPIAAKPSSAKAVALNLPPAGSPKMGFPAFKAGEFGGYKPPTKAGSVVGRGPEKNFGGHIPGFAGSKPGSKAPTVVGTLGNKAGAKPAPSKTGSLVNGGGPKFF